MRADVPTITVLGVPIAALTVDEAVALVDELYAAEGPASVLFANAHTLNLAAGSANFRDLLTRADVVFNDGAGVALAARLWGRRFPANLNGTDLTPRLLAVAAERGWRTYVLGGKPGVAAAAAARLSTSIGGLEIVGVHHGYDADERGVVDAVRATDPDVVVVAMGNPIQEQWLAAHLAATGARLGLAVGAFVDFAAGVVPRAPSWMARARLEWLYRLYLEPRRMWRRYVLGNPRFVARIVAERLRAAWSANRARR